MTDSRIILHHYPRSPFAEKVRIAFGLKSVRWHSVIQPRMAPKPTLTALTGGYRRIPVMQIGADIFCDTRCILREIDRRFPEPALYPEHSKGIADMIAAWADRHLFANTLGLVFGLHGDRFPPELHADRARFTAGKFDGWDSAKMRARIPDLRRELGIHLSWLEQVLADGRAFLLDGELSLADLAVYHPLWYLRGNLDEAFLNDALGLGGHPRLQAWLARMDAIGHGTMQDLSPEDALAIARDATPSTPRNDADSPGPWLPGARVTVTPDDWGFDPVEGEVMSVNADTIALKRNDPFVGTVVVHFPLHGFNLAAAD
ncbi:MAG: glutathione S-transferase family protein [Proteobacteria bacterium]|nr:glutathione S-transferase family protein [Pseudomonadota bacterium]